MFVAVSLSCVLLQNQKCILLLTPWVSNPSVTYIGLCVAPFIKPMQYSAGNSSHSWCCCFFKLSSLLTTYSTPWVCMAGTSNLPCSSYIWLLFFCGCSHTLVNLCCWSGHVLWLHKRLALKYLIRNNHFMIL